VLLAPEFLRARKFCVSQHGGCLPVKDQVDYDLSFRVPNRHGTDRFGQYYGVREMG